MNMNDASIFSHVNEKELIPQYITTGMSTDRAMESRDFDSMLAKQHQTAMTKQGDSRINNIHMSIDSTISQTQRHHVMTKRTAGSSYVTTSQKKQRSMMT